MKKIRDSKGQFVKGHSQINTGQSWIKKGERRGIETEFKKGNPAPKTAFKKGYVPWNKQDIFINCDYCSKRFKQVKNKIEEYANHFCCMECCNLWKSENMRREKAGGWRGGRSLELYPKNWTETLREKIRKRDNYTCQLCGRKQEKELKTRKRKLAVHHIDYDKENLNPNNLITLCITCHKKTNQNRKYWTKYFYEKR